MKMELLTIINKITAFGKLKKEIAVLFTVVSTDLSGTEEWYINDCLSACCLTICYNQQISLKALETANEHHIVPW